MLASAVRFLFTAFMQRFFPDFDSIDHFTLSLRCFAEKVHCPHCTKSDHLISHGIIYKQRSINKREAVGKRVLCSNRFQHKGCGRTVQLYVATTIPTVQYATATVFAFLFSLLMNFDIATAYRTATGQTDARHAWRWLHRIHLRLSDFRTFVFARCESLAATFTTRCRRLQVLLPTLHALFSLQPVAPCAHYQLSSQQPLF
jgi:hypothetical protein